MSEDLTKKLPRNDSDRLILTAINNLDSHVRISFDNLVTWISSIDARLQKLEEKVELRLYDTRPIWHKIVADIGVLQKGQEALRAELHELNKTLGIPPKSST